MSPGGPTSTASAAHSETLGMAGGDAFAGREARTLCDDEPDSVDAGRRQRVVAASVGFEEGMALTPLRGVTGSAKAGGGPGSGKHTIQW